MVAAEKLCLKEELEEQVVVELVIQNQILVVAMGLQILAVVEVAPEVVLHLLAVLVVLV